MSANSQTALLAHIAAQTKANIEFLVSQRYVSAEDARDVMQKLSSFGDSQRAQNYPSMAQPMPHLNRTASSSSRFSSAASGSSITRSPSPRPMLSSSTPSYSARPAPPPIPRIQRAKAIWDYHGQEAEDLSFREGDTIEIIEEKNADWWTGSLNGRRGLFPSNYVEKIDAPMFAPMPLRSRSPAPTPVPPPLSPGFSFPSPSVPSYPYPTPSPSGYGSSPSGYGSTPAGPPPAPPGGPNSGWTSQYNAAPPSQYQSPPPNHDQNTGGVKHAGYFTQQQPQQNIPAAPPVPDQSKKKHRFDDLGKRVITGAAGGVGFGVGSSIINSIF